MRRSGESLFLRKLVLGIPAQASGKNLTRPPMPSAPRFVLVTSSRPNPTQQGVRTLAPNDLTPCRMAFYFVSTFAIAQTPTKQPALRLSRTKNLHFAKATFPGFSAHQGCGERTRTQYDWGPERISGHVKILLLAWAEMPKTSFRKNSDSPPQLFLFKLKITFFVLCQSITYTLKTFQGEGIELPSGF